MLRNLADCYEVHHEDEGFVGLDGPARSTGAVGKLGRDFKATAAADLHAKQALVPALDDLADSHAEVQRCAAAPGRVEFLAGGPSNANVVGGDGVAGLSLGAVTNDDVLDNEFRRTSPSGKSISGLVRS
ncbi:hypothetical protein AHiyo8_63960 [Arthrobacter sp. Hiyo8]|nr:hypothetical protein AHiyo8_63960 [Arthrobacter sp. Hiyo8]